MITDSKLLLDSARSLTSTGVTANAVPALNQCPDLGEGEPLVAVANITTTAAAATPNDSSSVEFRVVSSASDSSTTLTWTGAASPGATSFSGAMVSGKGVYTKIAHGLATGHMVQITGATVPSTLTVNRYYVVIRLTADTFTLATTMANAFAGTSALTADVGTVTGYSFVIQPIIIASSGAVNHAMLSSGATVKVMASPGFVYGSTAIPLHSYVVGQVVVNGTISAGVASIQLVKNTHGLKYHASGFTLS